jgi:hypothetical protein
MKFKPRASFNIDDIVIIKDTQLCGIVKEIDADFRCRVLIPMAQLNDCLNDDYYVRWLPEKDLI